MATNYPLLIFPTPTSLGKGKGSPFRPKNIHKPSIQRQYERLSPIFGRLTEAFETQRIEIQSTSEGIDPEQVLIFETIGSTDDFVTAIRNTEGLEWMSELVIDDIHPDDDFYEVNGSAHSPNSLLGKLFMTMTNKRALDEMLSLWERYSHNPNLQFIRGTAGFKSLFNNLKDIRRWDVQDRLNETGILQIWEDNLNMGTQVEKFEIQLWFYTSEEKRYEVQSDIIDIIKNVGGSIITCSIIPEISYHALLVELPATEIQNIINSPTTILVRNHRIMFFRPTGQMCINIDDDETYEIEEKEIPSINQYLPKGAPVAALFDGVPLENHYYLSNRLIVDDPENYSENYEFQNRVHGTGMSSLIIHGDLNIIEDPISTPLYVRPIMKLRYWGDKKSEVVPDDILFVDLLHRAVKRIFDGDTDSEPITSIKVINLSIGDPSLLFYHSMSPVAKLLDWLSYKYKVLFIISTGNHCHTLELSEAFREFKNLTDNEKEKLIYSKIIKDQRNRRLLSPSESINNITVGSVHYDYTDLRKISVYDRRINPTNKLLPSIHSAFGGGYRNSIKPDFVYYGGRQFFKEQFLENQPTKLDYHVQHQIPGNLVAAPIDNLQKTWYSHGTSDATALTTRNAIKINDVLKEIFQANYESSTFNQYISLLIKVLLAHGCSWSKIEDDMYNVLDEIYSKAEIKKIITKWVGYGLPNINKTLECTEQQVTVLGFGELSTDNAHLYKFPLPASLSSVRGNRKLTITLGWFSPVASKTQKYRTANLYFESTSKLNINRDDADWRQVKKGTLQHEIFIGDSAVAFENEDSIEIKITCKSDAQKLTENIPYAIAVTLEVANEIGIQIYQEVKEKLITPILIEQTF